MYRLTTPERRERPAIPINPTGGSAVIARPALVILGLLAAGLDFRLKDLRFSGPNTNALELLLLFSLLILLADLVVNRKQLGQLLSAAWRANASLIIYFAWGLVAGLIGLTWLPLSIFVWRNMVPALMLFILTVVAIENAQDVRRLLYWYLLSALPNELISIPQRLFGKPFPVKMNAATAMKMDVDGSFITSAVSGFFNHPNALSVFLIPVCVVSAGLFFKDREAGLAGRTFSLLSLVLSLGVLWLTHAKGAWAWTAFGFGLLMLPSGVLKRRGTWLVLVALTCALIAALVWISLHLGGSLQTMLTRVLLWKSALSALAHDPAMLLFGGAQEAVWFASAKMADLQYANAHNTYLNQAVNFGLPGAVFYILMILSGVRGATNSIRAPATKGAKDTSQIIMIAILGIAGEYFFEPAADSSGQVATLCFFLALAAAMYRLHAGNDIKK